MRSEADMANTLLDEKQKQLANIRGLKKEYIFLTKKSDSMMQNLQNFINQGVRLKKDVKI